MLITAGIRPLTHFIEDFQQWKKGERDHLEIDEAIHKAHKECQRVYSFFCTRRKILLEYIQYDREWFGAWLQAHPAPPGIVLLSPLPDGLFSDGDRS